MRDSKRYIILFLILGMGILLGLWHPGKQLERVDHFRGARLEPSVWNPLIAADINEREISLLLDNREVSSKNTGIFMNENLTLMLPVSLLREGFRCSAHIYGEDELYIEKKEKEISFLVGQHSVTVNRERRKLSSAMTYRNGTYYVPADAVSELLDASYQWDMEKNQASIVNDAGAEGILPSRYDLREKQRTPRVKDQGGYGTCWAFAALSAMESRLLPEEELEFSPDHMARENSFFLETTDGGNYTLGMAYLTAWQGPVYESEDPYGDNESPKDLSPRKHVQEIQIIEVKDYSKIKEAVFQYGGVQTSIYSVQGTTGEEAGYYNPQTASYCYLGTEKPNHDVLIIGWDDNYPRENFKTDLEGDGAFICQNSWGSQFGQEGTFYISYYDVNIGSHNLVYTGIEEPDNYDHIYQSDLCGWVGQLGYGREEAYGANVYTATGAQELRAAGFYALGRDTEYELYVVTEFAGEDSLQERKMVASGKLSNAGFYTAVFHQPVAVKEGERYAVVIKLKTPGLEKPLAIEFNGDEFTSTADISDGESYISASGKRWESLEETQNSNLCLKVYSDDRQ